MIAIHSSSALRIAFAIAVAVILLAVSQSGASVRAASPVFVHPTDTTCGGMGTAGTDCFATILEAVENAGPAPATVSVFPGTYAESVDLSDMGSAIAGSPGDIILITVDAAGVPTPGTATVSSPTGEGPAFFSDAGFPGAVIIDGFSVTSADDDGIDLEVDGEVVIANVTANGSALDGLDLDASGNVTVIGSTANGNGADGLAATGINITITNSTANNNALDGFQWGDVEGAVVGDRLTATGNGGEGVSIDSQGVGDVDSITFQNSLIEGNGQGFDLADLAPAGTFQVNGNIICGNALLGGMVLSSDVTVDAEANWWGNASGPAPIGIGDLVVDGGNGGLGIVDFTPWIDTITARGDAASVGASSVVSFQFSGGLRFLGEGPGDPNGAAPFSLTTNNGTLTAPTGTGATVTTFINAPDGTVQVTLMPGAVGTATVTITGPCGLGGTIVLDVGAMPPSGDVNGDGVTTIADALLIAQCVAGLTGPCPGAGDVNGDGQVTIADALLIAQFVAGLIPGL